MGKGEEGKHEDTSKQQSYLKIISVLPMGVGWGEVPPCSKNEITLNEQKPLSITVFLEKGVNGVGSGI